MRNKGGKKNRFRHMLIAATAAAVAAGPLRKRMWRYVFYSLAGVEAINSLAGLRRQNKNRSYLEAAPEMERTDVVNGVKMRWEQHGDLDAGTIPVIMIHGLPTNPRVWRYVIPQLTQNGIPCLAWEQVGFGWSMQAGLGRDLSIPRQAEYLYEWLTHLGISKAVFVGHDYGGGVVQRLLATHPDVVAGIVLADSVAYDNWPVPAVALAKKVRSFINLLPPALLSPILYAAISNLKHSDKHLKEESFQLYREPYNRPSGPIALAHQLKHFRTKDTLENGDLLKQSEWKLPARVIWGDKDPLGVAYGKKLSQDLNAPLIRIPEGKHFTIEDQPEVIAGAVNEVVEEVMVTV